MVIRTEVLAKSLILLTLSIAPVFSSISQAAPQEEGGRDSGGGNSDGRTDCDNSNGKNCFMGESMSYDFPDSFLEEARGGRDSGGHGDENPECQNGQHCE